MGREYVPEVADRDQRAATSARAMASIGSTRRAWRTQAPSSRAKRDASEYISDGRGNVRIMAVSEVAGATGYDSGKIGYYYRTKASRDWKPLGAFDSLTDRRLPSARGRSRPRRRLRLQERGRAAAGRSTASRSTARRSETLVFAHPQVDVDGTGPDRPRASGSSESPTRPRSARRSISIRRWRRSAARCPRRCPACR